MAEFGGTLVDNGFEDGVDEATPTTGWDFVGIADATCVYDAANQGYKPSTATLSSMAVRLASGASTGEVRIPAFTLTTDGTKDGNEIRFWMYSPDISSGSAQATVTESTPNPVTLQWLNGNIRSFVQSGRTGIDGAYTTNAYNVIGTYSTSTLYQYRIRMNWTDATFTMDVRTAVYGSWTSLSKSGAASANIPMRYGPGSSTPTWSNKALRFGVVPDGANKTTYWFDEVQYADRAEGINEGRTRVACAVGARTAVNRAATR